MDVIHYSRCRMVPTPSLLAARLGLLDDWSLPDATMRVEFGDYDHKDDRLWMRHAGSAKSIWARSQGADTRVVALSGHDVPETIIVRANSALRTAVDLRGMRIAMPRVHGRAFDVDRHAFLMPLAAALRSAGLSLSDVHLVDTDFARTRVQNPTGPHEPRNFFEHAAEIFADQLNRGDVDAIVGILAPSVRDDPRFRAIHDTRNDPAPCARGELRMLAVSGALLREHRPVVVDAVARVLEGVRRIDAHGTADAAVHFLAAEMSIDEATMRSRSLDVAGWAGLGCSAENIALLDARKNLMLEAGSISHDFDVGAWLDPSVIEEAREHSAIQHAT